MLLYFEYQVFLAVDNVLSYYNRAHEEAKASLSISEILSSVSPFQCIKSKQYEIGRTSNFKC